MEVLFEAHRSLLVVMEKDVYLVYECRQWVGYSVTCKIHKVAGHFSANYLIVTHVVARERSEKGAMSCI